MENNKYLSDTTRGFAGHIKVLHDIAEEVCGQLVLSFQLEELLPSLRKYAYSLTKNKHDAEDLYQSTMIKILKKRNSFIPGTNLGKRCRTIMKNAWIDLYRKRTTRSPINISMGIKEWEILENTYIPEKDSPTYKSKVEEVEKLIASLEDNYKIPLMLHVYYYLTYEEIAEVMDIPLGTVKSRIFKARKKLENQLGR